MNISFTQIKVHKGRVVLNWIQRYGEGLYRNFSVDSPEEPLISFYDAMKDLRKQYLKILELPEEFESRVHVHTLNFSFKGEDHTPQIIISAKIDLNESPGSFNVNTPLRLLDGTGELSLGKVAIKKIQAIIDEATRYIAGEKKQYGLFDEAPKGKLSLAEVS